jgi:hypothetical protein
LRAQALMHDHLHVHLNEQNLIWRKASASNPTRKCVELAKLSSGEIAVRNSRFPDGSVVVYTRAEIAAFLDGARAGEFDDMAT